MNYRKCSVLLLILWIAIETEETDKRIKRLSSPFRDEDTEQMAKYVVSIRSNKPQFIFGDNHLCGGAIVSSNYVLTAAKCTMSKLKVMYLTRTLYVVGGTPHRLRSVATTVSIGVKKIFRPSKVFTEYGNNIALLQLRESWPTGNPGIDIIKLPSESPNNSSVFMVLGWGRFYRGGPLAGNLMHISVELLERDKCEQMFRKLLPEMLCAGNVSATVDEHPCAGDTGAPMIYNHTVYGVVAHRVGCGYTSMPSIYTDVWYHMAWISETIRNSCPSFRVRIKLHSYILMFASTSLSICNSV